MSEAGLKKRRCVMRRITYLYILSDESNAVLATGVAQDLKGYLTDARTLIKSQNGKTKSNKNQGMKLVCYETFPCMDAVFEREQEVKAMSRTERIELIGTQNPNWRDMYEEL
jgi:putative endonuclease